MLPKLLIGVLLVAAVQCQELIEHTTINITQGLIQGLVVGNHVEFLGIPYAGHVDGENRFRAAPPAPEFPGLFMATTPNIRCIQPSSSGIVGDENCLYLNIFTKNTTGARPVMVWLNGENYNSNSYESFNFIRLVEHEDILVVTLNYRLSMFGFLCLGVEEAPGNAGLKDVIAGLRWIRDNIANFGGNPNNVMLAGHGSAAAMVDLVTLSPMGTGLVHKAIAHSGSALSPWAVSYNPIQVAQEIASRLNITETDRSQLAIHLRNTPLIALIPALENPVVFNNLASFAPCVEAPLASGEAFMTQAPLTVLRSGDYSHIPFITGFTNKEGSVRAHQAAHEGWLEQMEINFEAFLPADLGLADVENRTEIVNDIRRYYFREQAVSFETINDYLDYHGDTLTLVSAIRTATERAANSRAEVRLYEFSFVGSWAREWPYPNVPIDGAPHGQELVYLLGTGTLFDAPGTNNNLVRDSLTRRWAAFARNNVPTAVGIVGNVAWESVTTNSIRYLEYVEVAQTGLIENARINPHVQRMNFWNNLYEQYYVPPQQVSSAGKIYSCAFIIMICASLLRLF